LADAGGIVADMSDVEIVNPVPVEDVEPWLRQLMTTLLRDPYADEFPHFVERRRGRWLAERSWGARDRGRYVGTLATEPRVLTVPGGDGSTRDLTADALTAVTVAATHRRRGLLTTMLGESLRAAKDRGDAVSILLAAEWPIYGRFGYAPAALYGEHVFHTRRAGATVLPSASGLVRQVEADELMQHAPAIFDRARRLRAGQVDRPTSWWQAFLGVGGPPVSGRRNLVIHEGPDGPDGLLDWKVTRDFELDGRYGAIEVQSLVAATPGAHRNLWAYLSSLDVIDEVKLANLPIDEPARHLMTDGRALEQRYTGDFLWLALLDVPAALAARGYAVEGRVVLDVVDSSLTGYATGRVLLEADHDGASCHPTSASPDLTVTARCLASAYLGGHSMQALALSGGVEEHRRGALQRLDAMLRTGIAPWCQTGF
jgi:predicted acetyltransferase